MFARSAPDERLTCAAAPLALRSASHTTLAPSRPAPLSAPRPSPQPRLPSDPQANGIRASGAKFFTLNADERSIYGKKQADGIILVKTKQAILVAEYLHPTVPGEATKVVEDLADYLIGVSY